MTLKEFAEGRGIDYGTLMQWLWHRPELRKQMKKEGKSYVLDPESEVYTALDEKYPPPRPIQVVQDEEARKALADAQKKIEMLQDRLLQAGEQLRELEGTRLLLEQRNQEFEHLQAREKEAREAAAESKAEAEMQKMAAQEAREEADRLRTEAAEAEKAAEEAKSRADRMESAGLFSRIFKSW